MKMRAATPIKSNPATFPKPTSWDDIAPLIGLGAAVEDAPEEGPEVFDPAPLTEVTTVVV